MATDFALRFINPFTGIRMGEIKVFSHLEYILKENEVGALDLYVPYGAINSSFYRIDTQIEIHRRPSGLQAGYLEGQTAWFVRRPVRTIMTSTEKILHITAVSAFELIDRIVVPMDSSSPFSDKWDNADDMMKTLVKEQAGSLASDSARNREPYLTVEANKSEGSVIRKNCARAKLTDIFKDLINNCQEQGVYLVYDVVRTQQNRFELRTYIGMRGDDRRYLTASTGSGSLTGVEISEDYSTESNVIYAAGVGVGSEQIQTVSLDTARIAISPYNRREMIFDAKNSGSDPSSPDTLDRLQDESDAELNAMRPRVTISGQLLDIPDMCYGEHYFWGDILNAKAFEYTLPVHVYSVHNVAEMGKESVQIQVQGEASL